MTDFVDLVICPRTRVFFFFFFFFFFESSANQPPHYPSRGRFWRIKKKKKTKTETDPAIVAERFVNAMTPTSFDEASKACGVFPKDIQLASKRISNYIHCTPVLTSQQMNEWLNQPATTTSPSFHYFKAESFQKTGSFKYRGALNAVLTGIEHGDTRPIVSHSSGNHGQAVAAAGALLKRDVYIVVPTSASSSKRDAIRAYGAHIVPCAPDMNARSETANKIRSDLNGVIISPFTDRLVIAGQGTIARELILDQVPQLDAIVVSVGGAGLLSGVAIAAKNENRNIKVIGVEPKLSNSAQQSLNAGKRVQVPYDVATVADGIKASIGEVGWQVVHRIVDKVVSVSEEEIKEATRMVFERMKLVIEAAAGAAVAAVRKEEFKALGCNHVAIVLCGGNVDLDNLPWLI